MSSPANACSARSAPHSPTSGRREAPDDRAVAARLPVPRTSSDPAAVLDLLAENLADYRALVHRTTPAELPALIARLLAEHGSRSLAVPAGLPEEWLARRGGRRTRRRDADTG